ncbi:PfkB family carbohydrate kinase [Guggenheimella bovis]
MKKILLFNDLPGYGKVALNAMIPILSHYGYDLSTLPSALVSNTLDYGLFEILDTTEYMKKSLQVWDQLGFQFDALTVGFLVNDKQVDIITNYIKTRKEKPFVMLDPIMGDNGVLYHGVTDEAIERMRQMVSLSDVVVPNITEAKFLTSKCLEKESLRTDDVYSILNGLRELGAKRIVITSVLCEGKTIVATDDGTQKALIPYEEIPVSFPGTGDVFSSFLLGSLLEEKSLFDAASYSMQAVKKLIDWNRELVDRYKGIPLEKDLHRLMK